MANEPAGGGRLLAIDDHCDSADLVVRVARKCGYDARALASQADLQTILQDWIPDVLTLDLCMPDADGIRLMSVLEGSNFKGHIIIISGQDDWLRKSAARLAMLHGLRVVDDFSKPVDLARLRELLAKLLSPGSVAAA